LVGESGCGKTTTSKLVLGLERPTSGVIRFQGEEISRLDREGWRRSRRSVQAVFQDPYASLDPRMRIGAIIAEPLVINERAGRAERHRQVRELRELLALPERSVDLFPHEFSGGQRQRIAIARALALSPKLIVLDEPVSALDVSIRAQILNLLHDLQKRLGLSYLFIAHDLAAVAHMSDTVAVMYLGQIVEWGEATGGPRAEAPLHQGALRGGAPDRHRPAAAGDSPLRRGAEPARSSEQLPLPPAMSLRDAEVRAGRIAARIEGRPPRCLSSVLTTR
jgi:ABC-type glutathione transport system ATPase component